MVFVSAVSSVFQVIKFTQQEIADMVGSSREMVSRVFSELSKGDYISVRNKIVTINRELPKGW